MKMCQILFYITIYLIWISCKIKNGVYYKKKLILSISNIGYRCTFSKNFITVKEKKIIIKYIQFFSFYNENRSGKLITFNLCLLNLINTFF